MSSNQEPTVTETIHVRRHQQNVPVCILNNPNRQSTPFLTNGEFFFCCNSLVSPTTVEMSRTYVFSIQIYYKVW